MQFRYLVVILVLLVVVGCAVETEEIPDEYVLEEVEKEETVNETLAEAELIVEETECSEQWVCFGLEGKIYRYENCSFGQRVKCPLGCVDDECRTGEMCVSGFKCKSDVMKGFQKEDCSWIKEEKCPDGCENATCLEVNESVVAEEVVEEVVPQETIYSVTSSSPVEVAGHNISIRLIENGRVRLTVDGIHSEWIDEGGNYSFRTGVRIDVKEVLFQPYQGGKQMVGFTLE